MLQFVMAFSSAYGAEILLNVVLMFLLSYQRHHLIYDLTINFQPKHQTEKHLNADVLLSKFCCLS